MKRKRVNVVHGVCSHQPKELLGQSNGSARYQNRDQPHVYREDAMHQANFRKDFIFDFGHIFIEELQKRYRKEGEKRGEGEKKKYEAENVARTQHHT
jgi:hypothetical protein